MEGSTKYKILIADDHAIMRAGLRALLSSQPDLCVIGEVDNGRDALRLVGELQPNLVVMDLSMPHTNGTEAIQQIKKRFPNIKILALTMHRAEEYVHVTLKAGADGYVLKDDTDTELFVAIRSILKDKTYISPTVSDKVVSAYINSKSEKLSSSPSWGELTQREREVIKLIAEGYKNKDIANYLSLSPKTVEKHRANLMKKLDLHSISELTTYAIQNFIITS